MQQLRFFVSLLVAGAPCAAMADTSAALPAGVDKDVYCQLIVSEAADRAEHIADEQKARFAHMIEAIHLAENFYIGTAVTRLSDRQISEAAASADRAMAAESKDERGAHLQYCLNDATLRATHHAERLVAN